MTIFATLIASQALLFSGGSIDDLTGTLSKWSKGACITLLDDRGPYRAFKVDEKVSGDAKDVARLALARADLKLSILPYGVGASRGIFAMEVREGYPAAEEWITKRGQRVETIPDQAVQNAKLSLATGLNGGILVRQLSQRGFTKPLRMHWLFERMSVAVQAKETAERDFLSILASAIGAKFVEDDKEYRLDLDPAALREFAARTNENSLDDPHDPAVYIPYRQLSRRLSALAWREASLVTVSQAFAKPNGVSGYKPTRSSALLPLIRQKLQHMMRLADDPTVNKSRRETLSTLLGLADLDGEPRIVLGPDLITSVALPMSGGGTVLL